MVRILIIALLFSVPVFAQDAVKPQTIVVQPAPVTVQPGQVIIREIPPAQVLVSPLPQPVRIEKHEVNDTGFIPALERFQTLLAGFLALLAGIGAVIAGYKNAGAIEDQVRETILDNKRRDDDQRALECRLIATGFFGEARAIKKRLEILSAELMDDNTLSRTIKALKRYDTDASAPAHLWKGGEGDPRDLFPELPFEFYDNNIGKVGVLGPDLASRVIDIYDECSDYNRSNVKELNINSLIDRLPDMRASLSALPFWLADLQNELARKAGLN